MAVHILPVTRTIFHSVMQNSMREVDPDAQINDDMRMATQSTVNSINLFYPFPTPACWIINTWCVCV